MVWVPSTLVRKKRPGLSTARELCDSAAKWTIVSIPSPRSAFSAAAGSQMSPWTKTILSSMSDRLGRLPA